MVSQRRKKQPATEYTFNGWKGKNAIVCDSRIFERQIDGRMFVQNSKFSFFLSLSLFLSLHLTHSAVWTFNGNVLGITCKIHSICILRARMRFSWPGFVNSLCLVWMWLVDVLIKINVLHASFTSLWMRPKHQGVTLNGIAIDSLSRSRIERGEQWV